jgi:hypothetical protein
MSTIYTRKLFDFQCKRYRLLASTLSAHVQTNSTGDSHRPTSDKQNPEMLHTVMFSSLSFIHLHSMDPQRAGYGISQ